MKISQPSAGGVVVVGIPLDENSSFLRGAAEAPDAIRKAYRSDSSNTFTENGIDLSTTESWTDLGNLSVGPMPDAIEEIYVKIKSLVAQGRKILSLGGDHSITYPLVKAVSAAHGALSILHIDAHSDLYDTFEGNRFSHACPFARIMEEGLASRLVQVGIRTLNDHQRKQAQRFGVEVHEMKNWNDTVRLRFDGPLYISLDLDALDPAFVPGVSHYEPGGFSTRQVIQLLQQLDGEIVGADIVELNPSRDINNMTAMVAAKLFKELLDKMLR